MALRQHTKPQGRTFLKEKKLSEETMQLFDLIFDDQVEALELHLQRHPHLQINKKYRVKIQHGGTNHINELTPLFFALISLKLNATQVLLRKGVDPNIECFVTLLSNYTPLQFFLEFVLDILKKTNSLKTPGVKKEVTNLLLLFLDANVDFRIKKGTKSNLYFLCLFSDFIELRFFIRLMGKMKEGDKFKQWVNEASPSLTNESVPANNIMLVTADKPLLILCQKRQVMLVELFLQNGADPNVHISPGVPLLYYCLSSLLNFISTHSTFSKEEEEGRAQVLGLLMDGLHSAEDMEKAIQDHRSLVDILINHLGERVKDKLSDDMTYLHLLAGFNDEEYTRRFCLLGLDVNAKRKSSGSTPAHLAAEYGNLAPLRVLVEEFNCDLTTHCSGTIEMTEMNDEAIEKNRDRLVFAPSVICTPLCSAFQFQMVDPVNYLYSRLPQKDDANFMQFVTFTLSQWEEDTTRKFLQQLPELNKFLQGAPQPTLASTPQNIINYIQLGKTKLVLTLLRESQFTPDDFSEFLLTALIYQEKEIARILLEIKKDELISLMRTDAEYALCAIAWATDLDLLNLVLSHGATVLTKKFGHSPMHYAAEMNNVDALLLMLQRFPECVDLQLDEVSPLLRAAAFESDEACDVLLAHGASPLAFSTYGAVTPLLLFVHHNDTSRIQKMVERYPSLDLSDKTPAGKLPYLSAAARNKNADVFIMLFNQGARDLSLFSFGKKDSAFGNETQAIRWINSLNQPSIKTWFMQQLKQLKVHSQESGFMKTETAAPSRERRPSPKLADESAPPKEIAFFTPPPPSELFTWFGAVSSDDKNVIPISGGVRSFLYLDKELLIAQGCSPDLITSAYDSPCFNGVKIKKLNFLDIKCETRMGDIQSESSIEFEIRFRKTKARILLCPVRDETNKATLFIGCHYLKNGLHTVKDVRSLMASFSHSNLIELTRVGCDKKQKSHPSKK